jgi:hypothetical protein
MALTKVRLPVANIAAISSGTSDVTIGTAGGDIVVTRGGTTIATIGATGYTFGAGLQVSVGTVNSETVSLSTAAGAAATIATTLGQLGIETTSAHPMVLGANNTDGLTIETDGQVTLGVVGDTTTQLVDKGYIDTALALKASLADITAVIGTDGQLVIPNSTGNDLIIKWGKTANIGATSQAVTFASAFPNAIFTAYLSLNNTSSSGDNNTAYGNESTTGFTIYKGNGASHPVSWLAIGY